MIRHVANQSPTDGADVRISKSVSVLMEHLDVSAERVAVAIGVSRAAIFRKLAGENGWKATDVDALARYFRVTPNDLFSGDPLPGRRAGRAF